MTIIWHHLGLGDHIICNGLVREVIKRNENEEYNLIVKKHNLVSVKFMFKDIPNLDYLTVINEDLDADSYIVNLKPYKIVTAGSKFSWPHNATTWEDAFYIGNDLDFNKRWDSFFCSRDLESEKKIFNYFDVIENQYVFVHDDADRKLSIDTNFIENKDLKVVRPVKGLTENIFDYCYLIENSKEAHFIDSSFKVMTDSLMLKTEKIYHHINLLNGYKRADIRSSSKLNFKVIE